MENKDLNRIKVVLAEKTNGQQIIHTAPPANRVPQLMSDLFHWVSTTDAHPLIQSCVFHYEFEFIHPFIDGNGRMGRYWQTMLLSRWKGTFAWLPVETIVKDHQQDYYEAIAKSDAAGESTRFVEFMLGCLLDAMLNYKPRLSSHWPFRPYAKRRWYSRESLYIQTEIWSMCICWLFNQGKSKGQHHS